MSATLSHPITFSNLLVLLSPLASNWMSRFDQDFQESTIGSSFSLRQTLLGKHQLRMVEFLLEWLASGKTLVKQFGSALQFKWRP